jgi:hypothetical protein
MVISTLSENSVQSFNKLEKYHKGINTDALNAHLHLSHELIFIRHVNPRLLSAC